MSTLRSRAILLFVSATLVTMAGALASASATPGHGKHGPCEHGRHVGNPHCATSPSASASPDESSPAPSGDHGRHTGRCMHGRHVGNPHCLQPSPSTDPGGDSTPPPDEGSGSPDETGDPGDGTEQGDPGDPGDAPSPAPAQ